MVGTGFVNPASETMAMWMKKEENKKIRDDEVNGARGLVTTEYTGEWPELRT